MICPCSLHNLRPPSNHLEIRTALDLSRNTFEHVTHHRTRNLIHPRFEGIQKVERHIEDNSSPGIALRIGHDIANSLNLDALNVHFKEAKDAHRHSGKEAQRPRGTEAKRPTGTEAKRYVQAKRHPMGTRM